MDLSQLIYGTCSAAFVSLIALMLLRGRISGPGIAILAACVLTAVWSADLAFSSLLPESAGTVLDGLRLSAWLIVLAMLIGMRDQGRGRSLSLPFVLTVGFCLAVAISDTVLVFLEPSFKNGALLRGLHDLLRVGLGVAGLLATENLLRNAEQEVRRRLWPLCLALGATFAFELFLYADRLMVPGATPIAAAGRGMVGFLAVPLLAVAMARNRDWRVDIHVSRTLVLHTAALVASGVFCMALAVAGLFVRELGGAWGPQFELLTLVGSAVVLVVAIGSRDVRVHLKRFVSRHFFSHGFDYRTEWLRFVETVSQPGSKGDTLQVRVVRALAQIVDSPAGSLWYSQDGRGFVLEAAWNLSVERGRKLPAGDPFLAGFRDGSWIQERPAAVDAWPFDPSDAWMAIPLTHGEALIAFVILSPPPNGYRLDGETFDLLRAAGCQAASYLAEERSARALGDSRALYDFSKRFAFVVHDFKNLASQLGMVVANARRHMDNPEFRSDMLETLESSVARMNRLLEQMRAGARQMPPQIIVPDVVIADLEQELCALGMPIQTRLDARDCKAAIDRDQFRSILSHLVNNAREAARSASDVIVSSRRNGRLITIDVIDTGPGMDDEFIREEFLRPFRSTKSSGMGIGGYQIREMLRLAGGELEVISAKGSGTIMRCTIPVHDEAELVQSAA